MCVITVNTEICVCKKARGVKVTYIGFSDKMTRAITARADTSEVIRNQEIIDAFDVYNNMQ